MKLKLPSSLRSRIFLTSALLAVLSVGAAIYLVGIPSGHSRGQLIGRTPTNTFDELTQLAPEPAILDLAGVFCLLRLGEEEASTCGEQFAFLRFDLKLEEVPILRARKREEGVGADELRFEIRERAYGR